jgi:hypothetical protein
MYADDHHVCSCIYFRAKLKNSGEEHRLELEAALASKDGYEETKRLVDAQAALLESKRNNDALRQAHTELVSDCNVARTSLLSELLDDFQAAAATPAAGKPDGGVVDAHIGQVEAAHSGLLAKAAESQGLPTGGSRKNKDASDDDGGGGGEESSIARKARKAIDCVGGGSGAGGSKRALDPAKYQFVKISELVRLRLDKKERECQRVIAEAKTNLSVQGGGGGSGSTGTSMLSFTGGKVITTGASTNTGLMSASKARIPVAGEGGSGASGDAIGDDGMGAAAMVMQLERELEVMGNRNRKLEQRCVGLETELRDALGHADDLVVLKSKALQLLERQKAEKELRLQAEGATKLTNRKVLALSQHIEKLMLHLKHEAAAKAKAHESAGRASQEVSLLRARTAALLKRASNRDRIIVELKEGAKILEDQLRLMDEKYMELRTKLDYTRQSTGRDVLKYKAQASQLRAKWAMLSSQLPGSTGMTLLDEVNVSPQQQQGQQGTLLLQSAGSLNTDSMVSTGGPSVSFGPETVDSKGNGKAKKGKGMPPL